MGLVAKMTGIAVSKRLESYSEANRPAADYPAADLEALESIATSISARLPDLAKGLEAVLPDKLPKESQLSPDVRNAAIKLGQHLMALVPKSLDHQVTDARGQASAKGVDYESARDQFGKIRMALPAVPYFKDAVPDSLVAFAVANHVTPAELKTFESNLTKLQAMLPLVEMAGPDLAARITKLEELAGMATLADGPRA